ncbi:MAG: hypothetical protein ACI33P_06960 [Lysinibacillus sp.]
MYRFFNPLLPVELSMGVHVDGYVTAAKIQLPTIEQLLQDAKEWPEPSSPIPFAAEDMHRMKSHIQLVESAISQIPHHLKELETCLNASACFPAKCFIISDTIYYSHIDLHRHFLFAPLGYDAFLEKQLFCIVEMHADTTAKEIQKCSLGFSSEAIDSLVLYPLDLLYELEKFDAMESIEASEAHLEYCRKLLLGYFQADELYDLYEIEESHLLKYIGDPLALLRTIQKKHNDNRIRLSLAPHSPRQIDQALIELIHIERRVMKQLQLRPFWSREQFGAYTSQLQYTKRRLMGAAGLSQEQLDILMAHMPADFW